MLELRLPDKSRLAVRSAAIVDRPEPLDASCGVCSTEMGEFSKRIAALPAERIATYAVSMDLPFAQKRWCLAETVQNVGMLSDFRDHSFGYAYGVRMKEKGLLARSIIIVGGDGIVRYVQIVPDGTSEPDYDAAIAAAQAATSG